ncbi:MAG: NAD+ synthase, partial [Dehalococcoidia bacterium]|nr:NAD+ synthase [Dehalococcoidia bacterium]
MTAPADRSRQPSADRRVPDTLRVALAQLDTTVGDLEGNVAKLLQAARRAAEAGAELVAFPELAVTGYPPEDLLLRADFIERAEAALQELAARTAGLPPLIVGCVRLDQQLFNAAAVLHDGRVAGYYYKHELPNYGVFDELRYFQPGEQVPLFTIGGVPVGVTICEDIWYPGGPARAAALGGALLIVNLNASPFHAGKSGERERMLATRASDQGAVIVYVNQVGGQDEVVFDGNSLVLGPDGTVLARGASLEEELLIVDVPIDAVMRARLHDPRLRREQRLAQRIEPVAVTAAAAIRQRTPLAAAPLREPPDALAETYRALVVGTRDYVRKCGFDHGFVALSGGIDSALVGAIAVDALGPQHVTGVSLPSRYSSEGSIADARDLAQRLGIHLVTLPLEPAHRAVLDTLEREFA